MGYVKTPQEAAAIAEALSRPLFSAVHRLSVQFRTDPAVLRSLLPPPLEPDDDPIATATVGQWHSNFLGDMNGGSIYLPARHGDVVGAYVLAMYHDSEAPIQFGREVFGEPKKLARAVLQRDGGSIHGWVERNGVRLIEVRAEIGDDLGPTVTDRSTFNVKARTAVDGRGLQEDAILTRAQFHSIVHTRMTGPGEVTLRSTVHDPLADLPVLEVLTATYSSEDSHATCTAVAVIPADVFLPYHLGRLDDYASMDTTSSESSP
jgi:acetoacetate decarboxylase